MIEQKADSITSRVANINSNRPNIVPYTDFTVDSDRWGSSGQSNWYSLLTTTNLSLSWDNYLLGNNTSSATTNFIGIFTPVFTQNVVSGNPITLSFLGAHPAQVETFNRIALRNMATGDYQWFSSPGSTVMEYTPIDHSNTAGGGFSHGLYTLTVTPNFSGQARFLIGGHIGGDPTAAWIRINNVKVEKASNASAYTPSSNDANERWSQITQTTDSITSEVGKKVGNNEIISKINQSAEKVSINADKINLTAGSSLRLAVDNALRGGSAGVNLIGNTDFWINYDDFERTHTVSNTDETVRQSIILNTGFGKGWVRFRRADGALSYMWTRRSGRNYFSITKGRTYTFSTLAATNWDNELNYVHIRGENSPDVTQTLHGTRSGVTSTRERIGTVNGRGVYKHTYTFTADFTTSRGLMIFGLNNAAETTAGFYLSEWKLEEGDVATPYQERLSGNNIISQINADETSMVISSSKVSITADDINIDGKTIQIGSNPAITSLKTDVNDAQSTASTAKTQADAARVGSNIANSINNAPTSVRIMGDHINLTGNVTFETTEEYAKNGSAAYNRTVAYDKGTRAINPNVMSDWGMTTISGGKIQTDEMTARRLKLVRDDGATAVMDGMLKQDFLVNSFSPNFMSASNTMLDLIWSRGQWWCFTKQNDGYARTDNLTFNAYSFEHAARYLMVEVAVQSEGTGMFMRLHEFSAPSGVTAFSVSRGWTTAQMGTSGSTYYTFQVDLGVPTYKLRHFYLRVSPNSEGVNSSIAKFRILRMTQNDDKW